MLSDSSRFRFAGKESACICKCSYCAWRASPLTLGQEFKAQPGELKSGAWTPDPLNVTGWAVENPFLSDFSHPGACSLHPMRCTVTWLKNLILSKIIWLITHLNDWGALWLSLNKTAPSPFRKDFNYSLNPTRKTEIKLTESSWLISAKGKLKVTWFTAPTLLLCGILAVPMNVCLGKI